MEKKKKIAVSIAAGIISLPFILITLYIAFQIIGAIVNHAAGGIQTNKLTDYAADHGFEVLHSETFVGNSGNGNHVDLISSVYVRADRSVDDAREAVKPFDERTVVWEPKEESLKEIGITPPEEGVLLLRLFREAPFADNIEGH